MEGWMDGWSGRQWGGATVAVRSDGRWRVCVMISAVFLPVCVCVSLPPSLVMSMRLRSCLCLHCTTQHSRTSVHTCTSEHQHTAAESTLITHHCHAICSLCMCFFPVLHCCVSIASDRPRRPTTAWLHCTALHWASEREYTATHSLESIRV